MQIIGNIGLVVFKCVTLIISVSSVSRSTDFRVHILHTSTPCKMNT